MKVMDRFIRDASLDQRRFTHRGSALTALKVTTKTASAQKSGLRIVDLP
jgi:hypothetical protein